MEPRIVQIRGGVAAVGSGWAVVAETEQEARRLFEAAVMRHRAIEARPDPHPFPTASQRRAWQSVGAPLG